MEQAKGEAEEQARREAEEQAQREAEEQAKRERAKRIRLEKERRAARSLTAWRAEERVAAAQRDRVLDPIMTDRAGQGVLQL